MVTLIATQPHIRFQDIAKMSKPEYLVGLPSEFIVDLVNVLSKADSAEPLLDLFDKNVEILKVCSDQTKLFERLPGIYEKVLKLSKSEDVIFEFHEKVKNYVADASFDFQVQILRQYFVNIYLSLNSRKSKLSTLPRRCQAPDASVVVTFEI